MRDKVCIECRFKILNVHDSSNQKSDGEHWVCKKGWWHDETICLGTGFEIRWAERCPSFKRDK